MPNKTDVKKFIQQLLEDANCKKVHQVGDSNLNCACPFHRPAKNTTAFGISFTNEEWGYPFRCYSCKVTGTIISLIVFLKSCSYDQAKRIFFNKVIITPADTKTLKRKLANIRSPFPEELDHKLKLELPEMGSVKNMNRYLRDRNSEEHHKVLNIQRLIEIYKLYYCKKGFYGRRIIMPVRDINGKIIYFTNRATDEGALKTLHPPGFDNEDYLYGLYEARKCKKVIIVEGPFDVFQLYSGIKKLKINGVGVVAIFGTNMNEERASIIGDTFEQAYLLLDEDDAGREDHDGAINILRDYMQTTSLQGTINWGKDPGTCNIRLIKRIMGKVGSL